MKGSRARGSTHGEELLPAGRGRTAGGLRDTRPELLEAQALELLVEVVGLEDEVADMEVGDAVNLGDLSLVVLNNAEGNIASPLSH